MGGHAAKPADALAVLAEGCVMADLFPGTKPARAKPRVMMHGDDFGYDGDTTLAHMVCPKCGHCASWMKFDNDTEARHALPGVQFQSQGEGKWLKPNPPR